MIECKNGQAHIEGLFDDVAIEIGLVVTDFIRQYAMRHTEEETAQYKKGLADYLTYAVYIDDERRTKQC